MRQPAWGVIDLEHEVAALSDIELLMQLRLLLLVPSVSLLDILTRRRLDLLTAEAERRTNAVEAHP